MSITVLATSFDTADAGRIAKFWASALGRTVNAGASEDFAAVAPAPGGDPSDLMMFHRVPEGKTVKNRLHLDLVTGDVESETARLLSLGASQLRPIEDNGGGWVSFADPDGNEFDLIAG